MNPTGPAFTTRIDERGRVCTRCKQYKPWAAYTRSKRHSTGYVSACRECENESKNDARGGRKRAVPQPSLLPGIRARKYCTACNQWLDRDAFEPAKNGSLHRICRDCEAAYCDDGPHYCLTFGPNYHAAGLATGPTVARQLWTQRQIDVTATWPQKQTVTVEREV